jgi:hypothetical protein
MFLGMVCEIEGHCFEFWSLGAVVGMIRGGEQATTTLSAMLAFSISTL